VITHRNEAKIWKYGLTCPRRAVLNINFGEAEWSVNAGDVTAGGWFGHQRSDEINNILPIASEAATHNE